MANRTPYRVAASLRSASPRGSQTRLVASNRPLSLRSSRRAPLIAANANPAIGGRSGGRTPQAAVHPRVRIFGLLGRRRAACGPERARRRRQGRRHRAPHALPERNPRGRSMDADRAGRTERARQQDSSARVGQRGRALGQRGLTLDAPDSDPCRCQARQRQSHRRQAFVSARPLLHPPKQGPAGVFRHAVRTRLHPDRHDRPRLQRRPRCGAGVDGGNRVSLRRRKQLLPRAGHRRPGGVVLFRRPSSL